MKTSKLGFLSFVFASALFVACGGNAEKSADTETETTEPEVAEKVEMTVDAEASEVMWKGTMLGIKSHYGRIQIAEGNVALEGDKVVGGEFTIDMSTIAPMDTNYNEEQTPSMLIGHLSSPDFFAVDSFPQAHFMITEVMGDKAKGKLTVRGTEGEETVENIQVMEEGGAKKITGTLTFDRKKYDVAWDSPMKEAVLSDDIEIEVELTAK